MCACVCVCVCVGGRGRHDRSMIREEIERSYLVLTASTHDASQVKRAKVKFHAPSAPIPAEDLEIIN